MREHRFRNLQFYYPHIVEDAEQFFWDSPYEILIRLKNGNMVAYDDLEHTIRRLPKDSRKITEEESRNELGYRLYRMMRVKGVTQKELSEKTGISQSSISHYITGKKTPSFYNIDKIAKALDCPIDEFTYNN